MDSDMSSEYIHNGLVHECGNSSALAMELPKFCAKPYIWFQDQTYIL